MPRRPRPSIHASSGLQFFARAPGFEGSSPGMIGETLNPASTCAASRQVSPASLFHFVPSGRKRLLKSPKNLSDERLSSFHSAGNAIPVSRTTGAARASRSAIRPPNPNVSTVPACLRQVTVAALKRAENHSDLLDRLTWTSICVPLLGEDAISMVPPTERTRSRMLGRPRPSVLFLRSKPTPSSAIRSNTRSSSAASRTSTLFARLCFITLCKASCTMRYKQSEIEGGNCGNLLAAKRIRRRFPRPISSHNRFTALERPAYSSWVG